jgi:hypothetical protein
MAFDFRQKVSMIIDTQQAFKYTLYPRLSSFWNKKYMSDKNLSTKFSIFVA